MTDRTGAHLRRWAGALGLDIEHADGCPGIVVPGVALIIDHGIPVERRHAKIADLLRLAGRADTTRRISFHSS